VVENEFYRINVTDRGIDSIFNKRTNAEILDTSKSQLHNSGGNSFQRIPDTPYRVRPIRLHRHCLTPSSVYVDYRPRGPVPPQNSRMSLAS